MKAVFVLLTVFAALPCFAQQITPAATAANTSQATFNRMILSKPPYGWKKVNALIPPFNAYDRKRAIDGPVYQSLSLPEKFTYNVLCAESYVQNCGGSGLKQGEKSRIYAYLPRAFGEFTWSERQKGFFKENADSVVKLLKECVTTTKHIGINFKRLILEMNASEMIPVIIDIYTNNGKDNDLLTLLMWMMKINGYAAFTGSPLHNKLYEANVEDEYPSVILDAGVEQLIITSALKFYNAPAK